MDTFCPNSKSIYKNFAKKLQKNCKKFAKKLQKSCKKVAKILQKFCKKLFQKNLQIFCRFFAEFLQLHILQKVLQFRPSEESVKEADEFGCTDAMGFLNWHIFASSFPLEVES